MKYSLLALCILSASLSFASGDVWLWKSGHFYKNEAVDSLTYVNPLTAASRYSANDTVCHLPVVYRITQDTLIAHLEGPEISAPILLSGNTLILHGQNLNYVDSVVVHGETVYSKDWEDCGLEEYRDSSNLSVSKPCKTDSTLRLSIPATDAMKWEGKAVFYVHNCHDSVTLGNVSFYNVEAVQAPDVYTADDEHAADGAELTLEGNFHHGEGIPLVGFNVSEPNEHGLDSAIWVQPTTFNEDWITVKVPEGVNENTFIAVKNIISGKIGFSAFRFRENKE